MMSNITTTYVTCIVFKNFSMFFESCCAYDVLHRVCTAKIDSIMLKLSDV